MGFQGLLLFVALFAGQSVCDNGWDDPELSEVGNSNINLINDPDAGWIINVAEDLKDSTENGIQLNYIGTSKLTLSPLKTFSVDISEDGKYLIFKNSPNYDAVGTTFEKFTISGEGSDKTVSGQLYLFNIDDNAPQASLDFSECRIDENTLTTKTPCTISVTDIDGCAENVNFELTGQGDEELFSIALDSSAPAKDYPECLAQLNNPSSAKYKLIVNKKLDFETVRNYFLTITYSDGRPNNGATTLQMIIQVNDVADMPPTWLRLQSTVTVNEEEEKNFTVEARDQDLGVNADICYSLQMTDENLTEEERKYFTIDEKLGVISIGKIERDKYQRNSYSLLLTAIECSNPTFSVEGTLVVQVLDSDNKMFDVSISGTDDNIFPTITIDENTVITFENTVIVTDPDEGDAGTFTATLDNEKFMVLPARGLKTATFVIQGLAPLDYEKDDEKEFTITLVIQEVKDNTHRVEIPINIKVNGINDNSPVFLNVKPEDTSIHVSVNEDIAEGVLIQIQATDADGDTIQYGMVDYLGLEINQDTGDITVKQAAFDYEQQPLVVLQVTAFDGNHTSYATLKIEVVDINDTPPTIRVNTVGTPQVAEDAKIGEIIDVVIIATDPDGTAKMEASVDWETTTGTKNNQQVNKERFKGWFDVSITGGTRNSADLNITVTDSLKWDVIDTIQLQITVTDANTEKGLKTSPASVNIIIKDVNNNAPDFGENCGANQPLLEMQENAPEKLVIGSILATDADGPGFNTIIYQLQDPNENRIKIDPAKGLISTGTQSVDYETDQTIQVVIVATDDTVEKLKNTCTVTISIIDLNDETPAGIAEPINVVIPENATDQLFISHITGTDADISDDFKEISYSMNTFQDYFTLVVQEGGADVFVHFKDEKTAFDFDEGVKEFDLSVILTDYPKDPTGGRLQKTSKTTVNVKLTDVNDNAPELVAPSERNCFFSVTELTQADAPLTGVDKLEATDKDSDANSWISYAITDVKCETETMKTCPDDKMDLFKVSGNTDTVTQNVKADIKSNKALTNKYGEYLVTVVASDHGELVLSSDPKKYRFCIIDENNNAPVIEYADKIVIRQDEATGKLIDDSTGLEIPLVTASDADFDKNGQVVFTLEPSDVFNLRSQGVNQAQLYLQGDVDLSQINDVDVTIKACDSPREGEPNCPTQKLTIKTRYIVPIEPVFANSTFDSLLTENDTHVFVDLPKATDKNNDDSVEPQAIYYFVLSTEPENARDYLTLGKEDGKLSLIMALDASICDHYVLTVQTTNTPEPPLPNPGPQSLLTVTIEVEDINDKYPIFERDQYTISMSPGDEGRNLLTLNATDPDRHDTVKYDIDLNSIDVSKLDATVSIDNMFSIDTTTGAIKIVHYPSQATRGYITFSASASDGNHTTSILVSVYVVSQKYVMPFQFANTEAELASHLNDVIKKLTEIFEVTCIPGQTFSDTQYTTLPVHFEDKNSIPIEPQDLASVSNNVTAMTELRVYLKDNYQLILVKVGLDAVVENTPEVINTALIAVSSVLAVLLIASVIFFLFKYRNLTHHVERLAKATTDVSVEPKGTILPNTNQNIGIGSNPLYNEEILPHLDNVSIQSGDSELIGIEDNPEFEQFYQEIHKKAAASGLTTDDMLREDPQLRALQLTNEVDMNY